MSDSDDPAHAWNRLAARTRRRFNFAWWLDRFAPWLVGSALLAAPFLVLARTFRIPLPAAALSAAGVLLLAGLGFLAWRLARRRFLDQEAALVRLEDHLHLDNALTTASRGVGPWPAPPQNEARTEDGLRWRWPIVLTPFLVSAAIVMAALLMPVVALSSRDDTLPPSEPLAWSQMESWLDSLEEEEFLEEEVLDDLREKVDALREQPEEEWFTHSSMEAGDSLRESLAQDIRELSQQLGRSERDLAALEKYGATMSDAAKQELGADLQKAIEGLQSGSLPLNESLRKALSNLDPSQLQQGMLDGMTPEQMKQLQEALKRGSEACKACQGSGAGSLGPLSESEKLEGILAMQKGQKPGRGGINRGRADAPLFYGDETTVDGGKMEGVTNPDLSRVAPGDVLGLGEAEHDHPDPEARTPGSAGAVGNQGQGGEALWQESLLPSEKAVLKRFFK